ncbi:hypothetical protein LguiB_016411 [Lonicera macranthoides]
MGLGRLDLGCGIEMKEGVEHAECRGWFGKGKIGDMTAIGIERSRSSSSSIISIIVSATGSYSIEE